MAWSFFLARIAFASIMQFFFNLLFAFNLFFFRSVRNALICFVIFSIFSLKIFPYFEALAYLEALANQRCTY